MKKILTMASVVMGASLLAVFTACDDQWEEGGDFNTSQGAGVNVNFSGVYRRWDGSVLIPEQPRTSSELVPEGEDGEAAITRLIITQIGNTIEVRDDYNKLYSGYVGSPGVMASSGGSYPAGATLLQAQISFSNNKNVDFVGTIRAVSATEILATTGSVSHVEGTSTNITVTPIDPLGEVVVVIDTSSGSSTGTGTDHDYRITEANTRYVLEGNWIRHHFDDVILIEAYARAISGTF